MKSGSAGISSIKVFLAKLRSLSTKETNSSGAISYSDSNNSPRPVLAAARFNFAEARVLACSVRAFTWQSRKTSTPCELRVA
jgi:hypothetical protein